jgi:hypothetical protein
MTDRDGQTDPTGLSFLSYRRSRLEEAGLLLQAQHDVGIPTWQDAEDLEQEPTEEALRETLADPVIANALLWLTPDVAESPMILKVEAPAILRRYRRSDGFFAHPVAAGGLDYAAAAATVAGCLDGEDLRNWNLEKAEGNPIGPGEAARIAARILGRRLSRVHDFLPSGEPVGLTLHSRTCPPRESGVPLSLDWSRRFDGRYAPLDTWRDALLPALNTVAKVIERRVAGRRVEASGRCCIPAAIALGAAFLAPRGVLVGWRQRMPDGTEQLWSLDARQEASALDVKVIPQDVGADDLAVLVGVSDDPMPAFEASRASLPRFRAMLRIAPRDDRAVVLGTPGQAVHAARMVEKAIRDVRADFRPGGSIHLFMAAPLGLAMLVGQLLNTVGPVQTYEHLTENTVGKYAAATVLTPGR